MKRLYVISGVAGMTGHELAIQILTNERHSIVIGFDNFFASNMDIIDEVKRNISTERFKFYKYDLIRSKDMFSLENHISKVKKHINPNEIVFIHCAAVVSTKHFYKPFETFEDNVLGTEMFLNFALRSKADKFINCSTSEVYGHGAWDSVKESEPISLDTAEHTLRTSYAIGKLLGEHLVKSSVMEGMIKACSIRFANVYSHNEPNSDHIIPYIVDSLSKGPQITLLENAKETRRTFLNNFDSCSSILSLVYTDHALDGSTYNVATDDEMYILELVNMIADKMGCRKINIIYAGVRESDPKRRLLNTEKIRTITGWKPMISLETGILQCIHGRPLDWCAPNVYDKPFWCTKDGDCKDKKCTQIDDDYCQYA